MTELLPWIYFHSTWALVLSYQGFGIVMVFKIRITITQIYLIHFYGITRVLRAVYVIIMRLCIL